MPRTYGLLSIDEHSRDSAGMTYVYPVVSRRAGGVSVGINLNPNNACNWRCIYCQVPDLKRGGPPPIDLGKLETELDRFLGDATTGDFMQRHVPEGARVLQDVAFSGNGEPTGADEFSDAVDIVAAVLAKRSQTAGLKLRLITNGSLVGRRRVREGVAKIGRANGEVWFKLDAANTEGIAAINGVRISPDAALRRLRDCAALCPTWVQTCFFMRDAKPPTQKELDAYVAALACVSDVIAGVHLYGLARPSLQPGAQRLGRLPREWFEAPAARLRSQGLKVSINP